MTEVTLETVSPERISPQRRRVLRKNIAEVALIGERIHFGLANIFERVGPLLPVKVDTEKAYADSQSSWLALSEDKRDYLYFLSEGHGRYLHIEHSSATDEADLSFITVVHRAPSETDPRNRLTMAALTHLDKRLHEGRFVHEGELWVDTVITAPENGYTNNPEEHLLKLRQNLVGVAKDYLNLRLG